MHSKICGSEGIGYEQVASLRPTPFTVAAQGPLPQLTPRTKRVGMCPVQLTYGREREKSQVSFTDGLVWSAEAKQK